MFAPADLPLPSRLYRLSRGFPARGIRSAADFFSLGTVAVFISANPTLRSNIAYEIHAHLDRASTRISDRVRERSEADSGGFYTMESPGQLQDRVVRDSSG